MASIPGTFRGVIGSDIPYENTLNTGGTPGGPVPGGGDLTGSYPSPILINYGPGASGPWLSIYTDNRGRVSTASTSASAGSILYTPSSPLNWPTVPTTVYGALNTLSEDNVTADPTVTAFAGGGQASAYSITKCVTNVTTAAAPAASVKLPAASAVYNTKIYYVKNNSLNAINIYPNGLDTINSSVSPISLAVGLVASFAAISTINWERLY